LPFLPFAVHSDEAKLKRLYRYLNELYMLRARFLLDVSHSVEQTSRKTRNSQKEKVGDAGAIEQETYLGTK
jgi:hypothetical protein